MFLLLGVIKNVVDVIKVNKKGNRVFFFLRDIKFFLLRNIFEFIVLTCVGRL